MFDLVIILIMYAIIQLFTEQTKHYFIKFNSCQQQ